LDGTLESTIPKCDFSHYSCLGGLERAIDEGIPVLGYQHWSVMENFVWAEGYDPRFGLIYVDFARENGLSRTAPGSIRKESTQMAQRCKVG
jgi:beta-glucosidase